jgi:NADH-quinone oxidoreductase subunit L
MLTSMGTTLLATLASVAPVGDDAAHHGPMPIVDATRPTDLGWAGLILLLPALSAVLCGLFAAMRVKNRLPGWTTVLSLAGAFVLVCVLWAHHDPSQPVVIHLFDWINFSWTDGARHESVVANFALYIDDLTIFWMLFVTGLGTLIALYATEYMDEDRGKGYARFFGSMSIFLLAMACLVMGDNLVMLYLGWEGVGLASYLLIGYYFQKPSAVDAAKKAFIMNRIGDLGLAIAIWLTWWNFGTLEYNGIFQAVNLYLPQAESGTLASVSMGDGPLGWSAYLIPWFLLLGACGKSAQLPLFTWLPDAMEGPTPVSALIHAATMVTAGVYLIARTLPLFWLDMMAGGGALVAVAWIGGITALVAATIALKQYDMKRVLAYSTISQLGYMFLGLGVVTSFGAAFHVFTHAFFKAMLFLCSGAVMHGLAGQLDLRKISGLRKVKGFGVVTWTMLIGSLFLAGFPFTAGFFSKDEILAQAFVQTGPGYRALGWIGIVTAGMTAYYTFRVWFRVFGGSEVRIEPGPEHTGDPSHFHPHPPGWRIKLVLLTLATGCLLSISSGYFGVGKWIKGMVGHSSASWGMPIHWDDSMPAFFGGDPHFTMYFVSGTFGLVGLGIAFYFHLANRKAATSLEHALARNPLTRWLPRALERKWYVDEVYNALFRFPTWLLARICYLFDRMVIDGVLVGGIARIPMLLGRVFQPLQTGMLQGYAATMAGGVTLIVAWVVWVWLSKGGG